jgi:hypothetical protein
MSKLDTNAFENLLNQKVKDHEFEYSDTAWANMQEKLDGEKKPFINFKFNKSMKTLLLLLLLLSASFLAGYQFLKFNSNRSVSVANETKGTTGLKNGGLADISENKNTTTNQTISPFSKSNVPATRQSGIAGFSIKKSPFIGDDKYLASAKNDKQKPDYFSGTAKSGDATTTGTTEANKNITASQLKETSLDSSGSTAKQKPAIRSIAKITKENPKITDIADPATKDPNNRTISFGPYFGIDYTSSTKSSQTYAYLGFSLGAFINFPLTDRFSIQSGLGYTNAYRDFQKYDTVITNTDARGAIAHVTYLQTNGLWFFKLPVILKYKINNKFKAMAGIQVSYAAYNWSSQFTYDCQKDSSGRFVPPTGSIDGTGLFNKNNDLNKFFVEIPLGLQWNMSKSFDLSALCFIGLTDGLKTTAHYKTTWGNTNDVTLELKLGYKLFHKRFHED